MVSFIDQVNVGLAINQIINPVNAFRAQGDSRLLIIPRPNLNPSAQ